MQWVRERFDLFGRPFFVPTGYVMPQRHVDDIYRVRNEMDFRRCPSCALIRHICLMREADQVDVIPGIHSNSSLVLHAPIPPNVQRVRVATARVCLFCKRHQLQEARERLPRKIGYKSSPLRKKQQ